MILLGYLTKVRLKTLLITFTVGAAAMALYARVKVRGGVWLGIPDLLSSVMVITLGSLLFNIVMTRIAKWR